MGWQKQLPLEFGSATIWDDGLTVWDVDSYENPVTWWDLSLDSNPWGEETSLRGV